MRPGAAAESGCQIVVVEDDEMVRRVLLRALLRFGYTVCGVATGEEAVSVVDRDASQLRLVITDVVLPGMSGQELVRTLAERVPELPVLFISGYAGDDLTRGGEFPADAQFLDKPFSPETLVSRVSEIIAAA